MLLLADELAELVTAGQLLARAHVLRRLRWRLRAGEGAKNM